MATSRSKPERSAPVLRVLALALLSLTASAQTNSMDNEWDLRKLLDSLSAGAQRIKPILDQADPGKWSDSTSGQSYAAQWTSVRKEIEYVASSTAAFAKQPERLTLALDSYFRLQTMEHSLTSFVEGTRRYGNPAVAELLDGAMRENSANRDHLRQYISELAQNKEQEFAIMDKEAQRCRNTLSSQTPSPRSGAKPKPAPAKPSPAKPAPTGIVPAKQ